MVVIQCAFIQKWIEVFSLPLHTFEILMNSAINVSFDNIVDKSFVKIVKNSLWSWKKHHKCILEHYFNEQPYAIQIKSYVMEKRALQINVIQVSMSE